MPHSQILHNSYLIHWWGRAGPTSGKNSASYGLSVWAASATSRACARSFASTISPWVLRGRKVPVIDPRLGRVLGLDAQGGEQGGEFQELRLLAGPHPVGKPCPRVRLERMPPPPLGLLGPDTPPQFLDRGRASRRNFAAAWTRREYHRGVDGVKGGLFCTPALPVVGLICNPRAVSRLPLPCLARATTWRRISGIPPRSWYCRRQIRRAPCPFWHRERWVPLACFPAFLPSVLWPCRHWTGT